MVQDALGVGAAVSGVADEISEVIDSMDRPIWTQVTTTTKGKTVTKTVWAVSKLDVLLFMVIGISAAIVFISLVESMAPTQELYGGLRTHLWARLGFSSQEEYEAAKGTLSPAEARARWEAGA